MDDKAVQDFQKEYDRELIGARNGVARLGLTLKNVRLNMAFSEETTCFMADIYQHGKRVGTAKNEGHGGETFYDLSGIPDNIESLDYWIDDEVDKLVQAKEDRRIAKTKDRFHIKSSVVGANSIYMEEGCGQIVMIRTKAATPEAFIQANQKYAGLKVLEFRLARIAAS